MEHALLAILPWAVPLIVGAVNLALTSRLLWLKETILGEVREHYEPRESCELRHNALDVTVERLCAAVDRLEGTLTVCHQHATPKIKCST